MRVFKTGWISLAVLAALALSSLAAPARAADAAKPAGTFAIGDKTFLLNGKPFLIRAAEIHYTRIPPQYWEQRIQMCQAMGMNAVCLYIFWNIHEQKPGVFDFTGPNDVAAFCRLAQKHGLYVILRPGPYVCAEWDMGGLPWWLLKNHDIKLRSLDPYYMERCKLFMNEVGKQLAPLQLSRGGNIIMVQVENEFGSSGNSDKPYISAIRDVVKAAGFSDVQLFQADWSSNFTLNALPDLFWTLNFGSGSDVTKEFSKLQQMRPSSPLMCSEYWSGWFDEWGKPHETRSIDSLIGSMRDMMERKISFSLYMAHGGTTFGQWGGANSPPYRAWCSSYDYDAPISEAGWTTPKFAAVRELLSKHLNPGETVPEAPAPFPVIQIPAFELRETAPVFSNLPPAKTSEAVKPMEDFDQGFGSILYRTKLSPSDSPRTLTVTEPHDWALVFVDGKRVGLLQWRRGEKTVRLPAVSKEATLDILVEAMGRSNFGPSVKNYKGITQKVELGEGTDKKELKGWEVFNLPMNDALLAGLKFAAAPAQGPAFYRGSFELAATGDTFLDMRTWGKGLVWVNGHCLGRFWKIGPQQTLFMPGCWLKQGANQITVLDLDGPEKTTIAGLAKPIIDQLRPDASLLHRKAGQQLDLAGVKPAAEGQFTTAAAAQDVKFAAPVKGRFFCLEALGTQGGDTSAAIAELNLLGADGQPLNRAAWSVVYADSEEVTAANNSADQVLDQQNTTFWLTDQTAKPALPHQLVLDLGSVQTVSGFRYLPRQAVRGRGRAAAPTAGLIKGYRAFVSESPFKF